MKKNNKPQKNDSPLSPWEKAQLNNQKNQPIDHNFWERLKKQNQAPSAKIFAPKSHLQRRKPSTQPVNLGYSKSLLTMLVVAVVVVLGTLIYLSPLNQLQQVSVVGGSDALNASVKQTIAAKYHKHARLIVGLMQVNATKTQLKQKFGQLKKVDFSYHNRQLTVKIVPYQTVAMVQEGTKYYSLTANAAKSKIAQTATGQYPLLVNFAKHQTQQAQLAHQLGKLSKSVVKAISQITFSPTASDPNRVILVMSDGNLVYAKITTLASKMQYYPSIKKQMKKTGTINLEVGAYSY